MTDSLILYNEALDLQKLNSENFNSIQKNSYLQILTTIFYELVAKKNSPLISAMCTSNGINFSGENFTVDLKCMRPLNCEKSSGDMFYILYGLSALFSNRQEACEQIYVSVRQKIFNNTELDVKNFAELKNNLNTIDNQLKNFLPKNSITKVAEEGELFQGLKNISKNRMADDEKIIGEVKKLQSTMQLEIKTIQESLKNISEIRDEVDFRGMQEPINQLIQLYYKLAENLKRHPQENIAEGYSALIRRCRNFLKYIIQSLEMLGVEIIDNTGEIFDPNKNKISEDKNFSLNSTVTKINKIGFIYKGQVIERAEVEISEGGAINEDWN